MIIDNNVALATQNGIRPPKNDPANACAISAYPHTGQVVTARCHCRFGMIPFYINQVLRELVSDV